MSDQVTEARKCAQAVYLACDAEVAPMLRELRARGALPRSAARCADSVGLLSPTPLRTAWRLVDGVGDPHRRHRLPCVARNVDTVTASPTKCEWCRHDEIEALAAERDALRAKLDQVAFFHPTTHGKPCGICEALGRYDTARIIEGEQ